MSVKWLQTRLYPEESSRDPVLRFCQILDTKLQPSSIVLDLGAGSGERNQYKIKGKVRQMVGVDVDERVTSNPLLDVGIIGDASHLPFEDQTFDLVFSIYVLEHISAPVAFLKEVQRVLKPGGIFLAITPNIYHYVAVISRFTPVSFHKWVNRRRGRAESHTFPTYYRMNSRLALKRLLLRSGLELEKFIMIESQPNYLKASIATFAVGALYERLVNATEWLSCLRVNIIVIARRASY